MGIGWTEFILIIFVALLLLDRASFRSLEKQQEKRCGNSSWLQKEFLTKKKK